MKGLAGAGRGRTGRRALPARSFFRRRHGAAARRSAETNPHRVYILPTGLGVSYGAILIATLLGSLNYQNNLALFLTFLMISASLVSMHQCWFGLLRLRLDARDGIPVFAGETARFTLLITETQGRARYNLCVEGHCGNLAPGAQLELEIAKTASRRGRLALGDVRLETGYPKGLFRAWTRVPLAAETTIYPRPAPRAPEPLATASFVYQGTGDMGTGADDFVGPRPYRAGDSPRQLDWKALARERGLIVKQFGGDRAARVWIDWDQVRAPDAEARLDILARQIVDAHEHGLRYGLILPGVRIEQAGGDAHKHQCLRALAYFGSDGEDAY